MPCHSRLISLFPFQPLPQSRRHPFREAVIVCNHTQQRSSYPARIELAHFPFGNRLMAPYPQPRGKGLLRVTDVQPKEPNVLRGPFHAANLPTRVA